MTEGIRCVRRPNREREVRPATDQNHQCIDRLRYSSPRRTGVGFFVSQENRHDS